MNKRPDVLVVGAGPVGMLAALGLARRGVSVTVVDQGWRPASHSYGVGLHPTSLELLESAGVLPLLGGHRVDGLLLTVAGEQRGWMAFEQLGSRLPFCLGLPQAELEEALAAELARLGVGIYWNHRLVDLRLDAARPRATVERLEKESTGYSYATTVWVVDKSWELEPRFILGADGYRSRVRHAIGESWERFGPARRSVALELTLPEGEAGAGSDLRVLLADGRAHAVWPLAEGRMRVTLDLGAAEVTDEERRKERALWSPREDPEWARALLAEWVPDLAGAAIGWAGVASFEPRVAREWARGNVVLAGDAAHSLPPQGVQSLNLGLREAVALAERIGSALAAGGEPDLAAHVTWARTEARRLLLPPRVVEAPAWVKDQASALQSALPATGELHAAMLHRFGLTPAPQDAPSVTLTH
jgi:2-polyprenyl-6-methoxyphenol hydroxylase-like FAD-dependent oxidoreductase